MTSTGGERLSTNRASENNSREKHGLKLDDEVRDTPNTSLTRSERYLFPDSSDSSSSKVRGGTTYRYCQHVTKPGVGEGVVARNRTSSASEWPINVQSLSASFIVSCHEVMVEIATSADIVLKAECQLCRELKRCNCRTCIPAVKLPSVPLMSSSGI